MQANEWLRLLADKMGVCGYPVSIEKDRIVVTILALDVRVESISLRDYESVVTAHVVVETKSLRMNLLGFGPSAREAAESCASAWIDGVFPVLHAWRRPEHRAHLGEETMQLLTYDHPRNQRSAWSLHLSPIRAVQLGNQAPPELPDQRAMLVEVFDDLRVIGTSTEKLLWLEFSASRLPDRSTDSSFRVSDESWPSCEASLRSWADGWPSRYGYVMVKQFLLLERIDEATLDDRFRQAFEADVRESEATIDAEHGEAEGWVTARLAAPAR